MTDLDFVAAQIKASIETKSKVLDSPNIQAQIVKIADKCARSIKNGGKILFAGNGGSFADSIHIAAEFVAKLHNDRVPLPAMALGTSGSSVTAIGNDYGYEHIFARELRALGRVGDVLVAISTSGNSPNILAAVAAAKDLGVFVYGFSGANGGKLATLCETVCIPSGDTARIQECHILVGHTLCALVERAAI